MARTDLVADGFTILRNAAILKKEDALIPYSKVLMRIMEIIKESGFIESFQEIDLGRTKKIKVYLKYKNKASAITMLKKISKSSRRVYVSKDDVPRVRGGLGYAVISTSQGIMRNDSARKNGVGGEVICYFW